MKCLDINDPIEKKIFEDQYLIAYKGDFEMAKKAYYIAEGENLIYDDFGNMNSIYVTMIKKTRNHHKALETLARTSVSIATGNITPFFEDLYAKLVAEGKEFDRVNLPNRPVKNSKPVKPVKKEEKKRVTVASSDHPNHVRLELGLRDNFNQESSGFFPSEALNEVDIIKWLHENGFKRFSVKRSKVNNKIYMTYNGRHMSHYMLRDLLARGDKRVFLSQKSEEKNIPENETDIAEKVETKYAEKVLKIKETLKSSESKDQRQTESFEFYKKMLEDQISYLYSQLKINRKNKDNKKSLKLEKLINDRETLLAEFIDNSIEEAIVKTGKEQLDFVKSQMSKPDLSSSELHELLYIVSLYNDITNTNLNFSLLSEEDFEEMEYIDPETGETVMDLSDYVKELQNIQKEASTLTRRVENLIKKEVLKIAKAKMGDSITEEDLFKDIPDIDMKGAEFLDASRQNVPLLHLMHQIFADAQTVANLKNTEMLDQNEEMTNKFKKSNFFKKYGFSKFISKDKTLTSEYKDEYWEKYREAIKNLKKGTKAAFKKGQNWFKDNHVYVSY
jgi:hypothetical protein